MFTMRSQFSGLDLATLDCCLQNEIILAVPHLFSNSFIFADITKR